LTQDLIDITTNALLKAWAGFISFVPALLIAIIIFVIGWIIALGVGRVVSQILIRLRFNRLFEEAGWKQALEKAEFEINPAEFIGAIFKWILVIIFLLIAVEVLGLKEFADFLTSVITWLPNLLVAIAIFIVAAIAADILGKLTVASLEKTKIGFSRVAGKIVKSSIWIFAILAILYQLGVAPSLIETLLIGIVAGLAIAFGIAFGLGGKDLAQHLLENWKSRFKK
jgi:hypothetical protein